MTASMAAALCELGDALPTALESVVTHAEESTALECVRHAACTGALEALQNPPPVLLHESKITSSNILYGAARPPSVEGAGYRHASDCELAQVRSGGFAGAVIMDVCKGRSCAASVWALGEGAHTSVEVRVYDAPLAAMEAELFDTRAPARAFEERWYKDGLQTAREYRKHVAEHVRLRGYSNMPSWMHSGEYAIERPGVLPLLRLRQSATAAEDEAVARLLEYEHVPAEGFTSLRALAERAGAAVGVTTTFFAASRVSSRLPQPDEDKNCTQARHTPVIGALALLVMKSLRERDYWGVLEQPPSPDHPVCGAPAPAEEGEEGEAEKDVGNLHAVLNQLHAKEAASSRRAADPADPADPAEQAERVSGARECALMTFTEPTRRACASKLVVRSHVPLQQAEHTFRSCLNASDAMIMMDVCGSDETSSFERRMSMLGSRLAHRYALLIIVKNSDGSIGHASLVAHDGEQRILNESITRYLMSSWVTPLVFDANIVSELKVQSIVREVPSLAECHRVAAVSEAHGRVPSHVCKLLAEATAALNAVAEVPTRLEALETAVNAPPSAALPLAVQPVAAAVGPRPPSAISRGIKRTIDLLEAYEQSLSRDQGGLGRPAPPREPHESDALPGREALRKLVGPRGRASSIK